VIRGPTVGNLKAERWSGQPYGGTPLCTILSDMDEKSALLRIYWMDGCKC